ncbi:MAG: CDP-diacylglycerol--serine O-phosphatidyltransferase, partial [Neisseriaceae bacterium]|nr:CDP-diacylglycerol--serine O-phosphatidyltransferase [Neisseriaceae bacterium]
MQPQDYRQKLLTLPRFKQDAEAMQTLFHAADYREKLLSLIIHAQQRIYLAALYLQEDAGGLLILEALFEAKKRNSALDIVIFVDWHRGQRGLIGAKQQLGNAAWYKKQIAERGIPLKIIGVPINTREMFGVFHFKGFVIDNTLLYTGASLNEVYLHTGDKYRADRYHLIKNQTLTDCFVKYLHNNIIPCYPNFRLDDGLLHRPKKPKPIITQFRNDLMYKTYDLNTSDQLVKGSNKQLNLIPLVGLGKKNNLLNQTILDLVSSATQSLIFCTPYFNFTAPLMRSVKHALKRGVRVEIIVGDKTANDFFIPETEPFKTIGAVPYLYEMNLRRYATKYANVLKTGQLSLRLWAHGTHSYHLKGLWVDDDFMLITGNNFNPRAFNLDLENAILLHDPLGEKNQEKQAELSHIR